MLTKAGVKKNLESMSTYDVKHSKSSFLFVFVFHGNVKALRTTGRGVRRINTPNRFKINQSQASERLVDQSQTA